MDWDASTVTTRYPVPNASYVFPVSGPPLPGDISLRDLLASMVTLKYAFTMHHHQQDVHTSLVAVHGCQVYEHAVLFDFSNRGGIHVTSTYVCAVLWLCCCHASVSRRGPCVAAPTSSPTAPARSTAAPLCCSCAK